MAYRRRQGLSRSSTFNEGILHPRDQDETTTSSAAATPSSPLAPQPNRPTDPRLQSFQSSGAFHASFKNRTKSGFVEKKSSATTYDYTSMKSTNEPGGFWGVIARKAKSILDHNGSPKQSNTPSIAKPEAVSFSTSNQFNGIQFEHSKKMEAPPRLKIHGLDRLTSCSLNQIGETIGNALEEGNRKSMRDMKSDEELMQELMQMRRGRGKNNEGKKVQMDPETQLKVSRDVAIATAAKAKVLLRELKRVKADLDSAKKRCSELEEENKMLREGDHPAHAHDDDDDMIRIQLETLLAEKGRLAHDNSVYARENRHLREIIEYHQLSMQDLVYWDDVTQEVQIDLSTPASVSASAWSRPMDPDTSQRPRLTTAKSV
ncbi:unnamed protein product [Lactuca virosa]|uniref:Uncharacterized protein n=1 Tax=Lactuca virosa TaxID=75947 RepID=A0AAU9LWA2_9ASTR|nr:unnamed protein product [Lactuca virosa]CAH1419283.1 unnamed protein product [Lactuca virosa]